MCVCVCVYIYIYIYICFGTPRFSITDAGSRQQSIRERARERADKAPSVSKLDSLTGPLWGSRNSEGGREPLKGVANL